MTLLGIAWAVIYVTLAVMLIAGSGLAFLGVATVWRSGDRGWAIAAVVIPVIVAWAMWTVKSS